LPFLLDLVLAASIGALVAVAVWRFPTSRLAPARPTAAAAEVVGETIGRHTRLRGAALRRLDPEVATGLALTLALALLVAGGFVLAVLTYLVRSSGTLVHVDQSVAQWGYDHASRLSNDGLNAITTLGETWLVVVVATFLVAAQWIRRRPVRWIALYLACVILGENAAMHAIKQLVDRVRPALNPIAETLGPSFPSGHSSTAAAFWAAAALVLGRGAPRLARALLAGGAVAVAVAVAGSRVLLDLHWLSDVVAGLALGWAWFAVCSIAFGGRILRFGAAAERAAQGIRRAEVDGATRERAAARRPNVLRRVFMPRSGAGDRHP
jgi:membrane-associated phospholipid phosphatase